MGCAQECTQANDTVIGIMAGPVKHLHYDGQPFRRLQEIAGVVREDRSVCWRVTKEVNWRLPVRVQSTTALFDCFARCV